MLRRSFTLLILCIQAVSIWASSVEKHLFLAVERGNVTTVKNLLEVHDLDPNIPNEFSCTSLHVACRHGFLNVVKLLVEEFDADIDVEDDEGDTPLYEAIMHRNVETVNYLLEKKASLEWHNDRDEGPVDVAVKTESTEMVRTVVRHLEPDREPRKRQTLHYAVIRDDLETVKVLLDVCVVHVDDRDESLQTPLHVAVCNGQPDLVYELILRGARVDVMDNRRKKPLAYAVSAHRSADPLSRGSFVRIIHLLVNAGSIQTSLKRCADQNCLCKQHQKKQRIK